MNHEIMKIYWEILSKEEIPMEINLQWELAFRLLFALIIGD